MITGIVIADGVDLKSTFGAYVADGGYVDVPCFAKMKEPEINDWYEESGIEVDLSSVFLESSEIVLNFKMNGSESELTAFRSFLTSRRQMEFDFVDISRIRTLRVDSFRSRGHDLGLFDIELVLVDDSPNTGLDSDDYFSSDKLTGIVIDNEDIGSFGVVLNGSIDGLYPHMTIKENKLSESAYINGERHYSGDNSPVTFDVDSVSVRGVMRSSDASDFWKKRDSLFKALTKEGERYVSYNGASFRAYYKDCRSILFSYYGRFWWEFELTLGYIGE